MQPRHETFVIRDHQHRLGRYALDTALIEGIDVEG
jgi:hypothetical protein